MPWLKKSNSTRQQGDGSSRPPPPPPVSSSSSQSHGSSRPSPLPPVSSSQSYGSSQPPPPPPVSSRPPPPPPVSGSRSYGGAPQPSPSPIHPSVSSGPGSAQSPYPPRGDFFQQPGTYAQQGDISYPGGAPSPGGFYLPSNTPLPIVITGTGSATYPNPSVSQMPQGPPDLVRDEAYAWFISVDQDGNGQLSHDELRSALLNDRGMPFSNSSVKYLMRIFDLDGNGSISFDEFADLWKFVTRWRELFVEFDANHDGSINAEELAYALAQHSCPVGRPVVNLLLKKYGSSAPRQYSQGIPRPQIPMDWFICACIIVEKLWRLYDEMGDRPRISRDKFLEEVISLP